MKVLYADLMSWGHHAQYNTNNIRILSKLCELHVYSRKDYLNLENFHVKHYESELNCFPNHLQHRSRIGYFLKTKIGQLRILKEVFKIDKKNRYDLIIFSCIDMISFSLFTKFTKKKIAFVDHAIYMTIQQKWQRFFWHILNPNLNVCVLEEYFAPYIRDELKCKNPIYLLKHPISILPIQDCTNQCDLKQDAGILVFAPSNSNDPGFIQDMVDNSSQIPDGFRIIMKGHNDIDGDKLRIYNSHLAREEYDSYFHHSDYVLIPYSEAYNYRTSGVLFDAIAAHKHILLKKGNTLEKYADEYPKLFILFSDTNELMSILPHNNISKDESEFERFIMNYSDDAIKKCFERLLSKEPIE